MLRKVQETQIYQELLRIIAPSLPPSLPSLPPPLPPLPPSPPSLPSFPPLPPLPSLPPSLSPSLQTAWETKAAEKVDDLLETFMGIRDLELGEHQLLAVQVKSENCVGGFA